MRARIPVRPWKQTAPPQAIDAGLDVDTRYEIWATAGGHEEVSRLILAEVGYQVPRRLPSGEKVNPKTAGLTAIKLAKRGKHRDIAKLLREARR